MINHKQFRELIIRPSTKAIDLWDESSEELLIMTLAQETLGATYLKQINGPALGPYECEPRTYQDYWNDLFYPTRRKVFNPNDPICDTFLCNKISKFIRCERYVVPDINLLINDLSYATIMCRIHYHFIEAPLPKKDDLTGLFAYYKKYYNTPKGKATEKEVLDNYQLYLKGR